VQNTGSGIFVFKHFQGRRLPPLLGGDRPIYAPNPPPTTTTNINTPRRSIHYTFSAAVGCKAIKSWAGLVTKWAITAFTLLSTLVYILALWGCVDFLAQSWISPGRTRIFLNKLIVHSVWNMADSRNFSTVLDPSVKSAKIRKLL
jgi:hypothetical protein